VERLLALTTCLLVSLPAMAFECPVPQPLPGPAVLKESAARTREVATLLGGRDLGNRVPVIVEDLRKRYPGVANAEVQNYLMAAYCPVVARLSGLGDAQKRARVDRVGREIRAAIYSEVEPTPASEPGSPRVDRQASVETRPPGSGRASVTFSDDTYQGGWDDILTAAGPIAVT
jgi:hypothetical protein